MWRFFDRHGISFKFEKPRTPPSRSALTSPRFFRHGLARRRRCPISIPRRLVFHRSETGASTKMARLRVADIARCQASFANAAVPRSHIKTIGRKTTTFTAAGLRRNHRPDRADAPGTGRRGQWGRLPWRPMSSRSSLPPWYSGDRGHHGQLACSSKVSGVETGNRERRARHVCFPAALFARASIPSNKPSPNSRPCITCGKAGARTGVVDDLWDAIAEIIELHCHHRPNERQSSPLALSDIGTRMMSEHAGLAFRLRFKTVSHHQAWPLAARG